MTVKIAHFADTHLGYRQYGLQEREDDFYDTFKCVVDEIIENKVDYVIHTGDLFEQAKPPIKALLVAQECFNKLIENDIEIFVIAGNHDILQKRNTSLPQELYRNDKFHILSTKNNCHILKEDIYLTGLPYLQKMHEENVKELLLELVKECENHKHSILMLHGGVKKFFDFECEFENETIPEGFDYYAMGHIHQRIIDKFKNGIMSYPGSTEIKDKSEVQENEKNGKGFTLVSIDEEVNVEYVNITIKREFIIENIKYYELDEKINKIADKIKNEILVKTTKKPILILNIVEGDFERSEVSTKIYDKLGDLSLTIKLSYEPTITESITQKVELLPIKTLKENIKENLGEEFEVLGVELYKSLSNQNIEEAKEISDTFYNKLHNNKIGEKDDN